jgi:hypothetical protein
VQHAVFVQPGKVEWRETEDPILQSPGEAIVRPIVVGRCDLDVGFVRGVYPLASGTPIGHSAWANCGFCPDRVPTLRVDWADAPVAWNSDAIYVAAVRGGIG